MSKILVEIGEEKISRMVVADPSVVVRHMRTNAGWIMILLTVLIGVMLVSAGAARCIPDGFKAGDAIKTLDPFDALYFTVISMTTVGFGDIVPVTPFAKALAIFNAIFGLIMFAGLVSVIMIAFSPDVSYHGPGFRWKWPGRLFRSRPPVAEGVPEVDTPAGNSVQSGSEPETSSGKTEYVGCVDELHAVRSGLSRILDKCRVSENDASNDGAGSAQAELRMLRDELKGLDLSVARLTRMHKVRVSLMNKCPSKAKNSKDSIQKI